MSELAAAPTRIEDRLKKISDGAGGLVETSVKFPVWVESVANGSTPMKEAMELGGHALADWCNRHMLSFPPFIINITDGEYNAGSDPSECAEGLKQIRTDDGEALLFNLHIASGGSKTVFPSSDAGLASQYAKQLFAMSSSLPPKFSEAAASSGYAILPGARGYGFNAEFSDLVRFLQIGTVAAR